MLVNLLGWDCVLITQRDAINNRQVGPKEVIALVVVFVVTLLLTEVS
jgi:hypothetical protein